jgi:hypothetical protein
MPAMLAFASWFLLRLRRGVAVDLLAAVLLGAGILSKTWPLMILPLLALEVDGGVYRKGAFAAIAVAVPALVSFTYATLLDGSLDQMLTLVRQYQGLTGYGGYSLIIGRLPGDAADTQARLVWVAEHGRTVFYTCMIITLAIILAARPRLELGITAMLVGVYVFAPAPTASYFVWILPFALIAGQRLFPAAYSVIAIAERCSVLCYDHYWKRWGDYWGPHAWWIGAAGWALMAIWFCVLMAPMVRDVARGRTLAFVPAWVRGSEAEPG